MCYIKKAASFLEPVHWRYSKDQLDAISNLIWSWWWCSIYFCFCLWVHQWLEKNRLRNVKNPLPWKWTKPHQNLAVQRHHPLCRRFTAASWREIKLMGKLISKENVSWLKMSLFFAMRKKIKIAFKIEKCGFCSNKWACPRSHHQSYKRIMIIWAQESTSN